MAHGRVGHWLYILVLGLVFLGTEGLYAGINIVHSAVAKGAVCLDGSPPAYHFDKGFGTGINNWVVHIEGGGWCSNITNCLARKNTRLGSSTKMEKLLAFSGILSNQRVFNPDFYNWNRVKIGYCDGSSFTGDVQAVNPATKLYFRGARIFPAVIQDLLAKGLNNSENAILSGCSAGGLSTILHCDSFKALLPMGTKVKCLSDAGYFINVKDLSGATHIQDYFNDIANLHGSGKSMPLGCAYRNRPGLCFFPENVVPGIRTPLFILNAAYDSWQIKNSLAPVTADAKGLWNGCKVDITKCSTIQIKTIQDFHQQFLSSLTRLGRSASRGLFINSCFAHCQTELQELWLMKGSPLLGGKAIANAVGDWFFDRVPFQKIDCPYPCNKSCRNSAPDRRESK